MVFDDFDQWVLMILISGFGILMGGLMMVGVLCGLIVDGGWVLVILDSVGSVRERERY